MHVSLYGVLDLDCLVLLSQRRVLSMEGDRDILNTPIAGGLRSEFRSGCNIFD